MDKEVIFMTIDLIGKCLFNIRKLVQSNKFKPDAAKNSLPVILASLLNAYL